MLRKIVIAMSVLAFVFAAQAQYQVKSNYLKNPKKCLDFITNQADFFSKAKDGVNGGFYCHVDRAGNPVYPNQADPGTYFYWWWKDSMDAATARGEEYGNSWLQWQWPYNEFKHDLKSVTSHSRVAYAFLKAFQISGDEKYLALAKHALDFMYKYGWDYENGGWLFTTDAQGNMAPWIPGNWWDPNYFKWAYQQMYPLVGIGAMVEVTGGSGQVVPFPGGPSPSTDKDWYTGAYDVFNTNMWDSRPGYEGYYLNSSNLLWSGAMWQNPETKSFTGIVDAITTHASTQYLTLGGDFYRDRFNELANEGMIRLVNSSRNPANPIGFVTEYDSDWGTNGATNVSIGHVLKTSWVLARAYLALGDATYRDGARELLMNIYDKGGYDKVNGAPFAGADWGSGSLVCGPNKGSWETEQGVMAGLLNYAIATNPADKEISIKVADGSLDFFMNHFVDQTYGGHFYATDAVGNVVDNRKSDIWDQGYHASELAFYAYVYGSLLYKNQPVELYYQFDAQPTARTIKLNPIEGCDGRVAIQNVSLNGNGGYRYFKADTRELNIPANVGGKFKVMFKNTMPGRW